METEGNVEVPSILVVSTGKEIDTKTVTNELKDLKNHPPIITVRGNMDTLKKQMVSIVGTRHATASGMGLVADIAQNFAENDIAVVSITFNSFWITSKSETAVINLESQFTNFLAL